MTAPGPVPTSVEGADGRSVVPGHTIAYAATQGDSAVLRIAEVLGFQWSKAPNWRGEHALKMRVSSTGLSRSVLIDSGLRRFVRIT